jgi:hypothetical protein
MTMLSYRRSYLWAHLRTLEGESVHGLPAPQAAMPAMEDRKREGYFG